jgi:hypothetical protein
MDMMLLAVWGSVIFGALTIVLVGAWLVTGRKNKVLQILGGVAALLSALSATYMTSGA